MPTETPQPTQAAPSPPLTGPQKSAATVQRNRLRAREEKLRDIQDQIDQGTLVVRYLS